MAQLHIVCRPYHRTVLITLHALIGLQALLCREVFVQSNMGLCLIYGAGIWSLHCWKLLTSAVSLDTHSVNEPKRTSHYQCDGVPLGGEGVTWILYGEASLGFTQHLRLGAKLFINLDITVFRFLYLLPDDRPMR